MHQRFFSQGTVPVSEIGLGCWQLGGDWGPVSDDDAFATLRGAVGSGVSFLDTADVYGGGRSESVIGTFLKQSGDRPFVATKLGRGAPPDGMLPFSPEALRAATEASLQRLGVDALDLTQLHCLPMDELRRGDVFETLRTLQSEGKIVRFGASVESMEEALICLGQPGLASLQIIFNIFRQKPITALFDAAQAQGVALIIRLPLASGLLSGKYTQATQFAASDHRMYNRDGAAFNVGETFAGLPFETGVALADQIKPWVPPGMTMAQMALRWCLDFPAVTTLIPGAKGAEMARANSAASDLPPLPPDLHDKLTRLYNEQVAGAIRGPY